MSKSHPQIPQAASLGQLIRRVLGLLHNRRWTVAALLGLVLVASGLELVVPFLAQRLIDRIIHSLQKPQAPSVDLLVYSAAGIFLATAATRMVRSFYNYKLFRTCAVAEDSVKTAAFANFLHLDSAYQTHVNTGEVIGSLDRGGTAIFVVLYEIFGQNLIPPTIVFAGVLASLATKNLWIALAVMIPLPAYILVVSRLGGRMQRMEQETTRAFENVSKEAYDIASNVAVVKKFSREACESSRQVSLLDIARVKQFAAERLWALVENAQTCIATLGRVTVISLGGWLVLTRHCSVGDFVLFIALQDMVYGPVSQLSVILPKLRRNLSRCERLFEILDQRSSVPDAPDAAHLPALAHSVEFRNVGFRYPGSDRWTLRNVNFRVPAGATVALIGRSGSGKSTLVNLLQRCYDPQLGSILVDGVDIRTTTQESLRRQIAVVPQEVDLFSRSIRDNIAYGCPEAGNEAIEDAARIAQAHAFIERCEAAYDTHIGERGLKLSGGERQRIGIARAVLRDPRILILDEATSHLDNESERLVQQATDRITGGRTCFVIAHRLSTVEKADMVVVFAKGGIEAVGTHQELWANSPTYRRLRGGADAEVEELERLIA